MNETRHSAVVTHMPRARGVLSVTQLGNAGDWYTSRANLYADRLEREKVVEDTEKDCARYESALKSMHDPLH